MDVVCWSSDEDEDEDNETEHVGERFGRAGDSETRAASRWLTPRLRCPPATRVMGRGERAMSGDIGRVVWFVAIVMGE